MLSPILIISLAGIIISITFHEFAHAFVADRLGDPTPRSYGRLSLNPLAHIDLFGTIILPLISAIAHLPVLGWAKPTPIDPYNFSHPRRDEILVSIAGPISNILLAVVFSQLSRFAPVLMYVATINLYLAVFNLIPIPPLDGSRILINLVSEESALKISATLDRYGFVILFILVFTNVIYAITTPVVQFLAKILF